MIITDTLSNLFSAIQNAYLSNKFKIKQPNSNQNKNVLNIFIQEGIIKSYKINKNILEIYLKNNKKKNIIIKIKRISKPGKRIYITTKKLYNFKNKLLIISTPLGIVTNIQAHSFNVGGEILCEII